MAEASWPSQSLPRCEAWAKGGQPPTQEDKLFITTRSAPPHVKIFSVCRWFMMSSLYLSHHLLVLYKFDERNVNFEQKFVR